MTASVIAVSTSRDDTSDTTCNVTLPATINSGELLLILFWCDGSETITWDNSTAGMWTNLGTDYGTTISFAAYYKIADGTEDSKTLGVTVGNAQESHAVIFRITGHATSGTYIERAGVNISSVASKDPPNLAPVWGSGDTLWITAGGILTGAGSAQFTASPTNYTTNYASVIGTNGGVSVGYSWRANTASSEDPDAFTASTSGVAYMVTVGVKVDAPSGLTITSVNTTNTAFSTQTDSAVVGTGLSASVVCTYAGIACTNESASSSTSLKITFPNFFTNNIKLGRNYEFKVVG